jgi:RNA polymerase sigma-70 factor, ECF subfamily
MVVQLRSFGEAYAAARDRWPDIAIPEDVFAAHLSEHVPENTTLESALATMDIGDLYLACACARGEPSAIAALEPILASAIDNALRHIRADSDLSNEVRQVLRVQLLVAEPDERPKIATFAGRSTLDRWLRVAATRVALMGLRKDKKRVGWNDGDMLDVPAIAADPEIDYVRRRYGDELRVAFRQALAVLPADQRNLLRQSLLFQMTTAQIGAIHDVHRATAARWIADAREAVVTQVLQLLEPTLRLTRSELESLSRAVRSGFDLSLHDVL